MPKFKALEALDAKDAEHKREVERLEAQVGPEHDTIVSHLQAEIARLKEEYKAFILKVENSDQEGAKLEEKLQAELKEAREEITGLEGMMSLISNLVMPGVTDSVDAFKDVMYQNIKLTAQRDELVGALEKIDILFGGMITKSYDPKTQTTWSTSLREEVGLRAILERVKGGG